MNEIVMTHSVDTMMARFSSAINKKYKGTGKILHNWQASNNGSFIEKKLQFKCAGCVCFIGFFFRQVKKVQLVAGVSENPFHVIW